MAESRSPRRRERRRIVCRADGSMFDVVARHGVTVEELRDHLVSGGLLEAETEETGRDCTYEVLRRLMGRPGLESVGGFGGSADGGFPGLGGGFNGLGQLAGLAKLFEVVAERADRDDRTERAPTRSRARARRAGLADQFLEARDGPSTGGPAA